MCLRGGEAVHHAGLLGVHRPRALARGAQEAVGEEGRQREVMAKKVQRVAW